MISENIANPKEAPPNLFTAADVERVLRERGWMTGEATEEQQSWCARAALLLGPHSADRGALAGLLERVFAYDAVAILDKVESHVVLARYSARKVIRKLALLLLDGVPVTSDHFRDVVEHLKEDCGLRGRDIFHPIRLSLAGSAGEGDLDRVILLVDAAATLPFAVAVKSVRARIVEFCAALG